MIGVSGWAERPSVFINDGYGTFIKKFLEINIQIFLVIVSIGKVLIFIPAMEVFYPFYGSNSLDMLYWTEGYVWRIPEFLGMILFFCQETLF